jgi:hypothetical protein
MASRWDQHVGLFIHIYTQIIGGGGGEKEKERRPKRKNRSLEYVLRMQQRTDGPNSPTEHTYPFLYMDIYTGF